MGMRRGKRRRDPKQFGVDEAQGLSTVIASVATNSGHLALFRLDRSFLGLVWDRLTISSTSGVVSVPQLFAHASEPLATLEVHVEALGAIAFPEDEMAEAKRDKKSKGEQEQQLSKELEQTFPASDPPASVQPGSGVTGPEVAKPKPKDN